MHLIKKIFQVL